MSKKRVLFLHEDPLITSIYREKLEAADFSVGSSRTAEEGLLAAAATRPDAIVIDPALRDPKLSAIFPKLRGIGGGPTIPAIILPTIRPVLAEAVHDASTDVQLARGANPVGNLIDALQSKLGLQKTPPPGGGLPFRTGNTHLESCLMAAPELITTLRRTLHEATREGTQSTALGDFFHHVHGFAEQLALLGERPLYTLTSQIEALAFDLSRFPEQVNPSVLRTLGQSLDFLATLLPDATRHLLKDPGASQVLVVDDEDGARKIIMMAMRMAALKSMAADTPASGLSALGVQGFDLIFLDVGLPEMNGFDLCTKIRALPMHEKTPIVFITGMATFQNRVQASLSGGNDFVGKPFILPELGLKALIWVFKGQLGQI